MHVPKSLPATETDESHKDSKVTNDRSIVYVYIYIEPYAIQYKNGRWSFNLQPSLFCDNMFLEPINLAWKTDTKARYVTAVSPSEQIPIYMDNS